MLLANHFGMDEPGKHYAECSKPEAEGPDCVVPLIGGLSGCGKPVAGDAESRTFLPRLSSPTGPGQRKVF